MSQARILLSRVVCLSSDSEKFVEKFEKGLDACIGFL